MSISAKTTTIASLIEAEAKQLAGAQKRHDTIVALIKALPAGSPAPQAVYDAGYCAEAALMFDGERDYAMNCRLLELYPPLEVVNLLGPRHTQKPVKYLRAEELDAPRLDIHPVVLKASTKMDSRQEMCWWTRLAGRTVAVSVANAMTGAARAPEWQYDKKSSSYGHSVSEYWVPKLKFVPGSPDGLALWQAEREAFLSEKEYGATQRRFAIALWATAKALPHRKLTLADLPEPVYMSPATAITSTGDENLVSKLDTLWAMQAARTAHPLDRVGNFWQAFSREKAEELLDFMWEHAKRHPDAAAKSELQAREVQDWLYKFFSTHPPLNTDGSVLPYITARIEQRCRIETGMAVKLSLWGDTGVHVHFTLSSGTERRVVFLPSADFPDGRKLGPQDVEVDYPVQAEYVQ